jgi:hypothetical protein
MLFNLERSCTISAEHMWASKECEAWAHLLAEDRLRLTTKAGLLSIVSPLPCRRRPRMVLCTWTRKQQLHSVKMPRTAGFVGYILSANCLIVWVAALKTAHEYDKAQRYPWPW